MSDATKGLIAWAVVLASGIAAGLGIGWKLWSPKAPVVETYAPPVKQPDGSLVLERKPQADAKAPQQIPKGAKVERIVQVTVHPNPGPEPLPPSAFDVSANDATLGSDRSTTADRQPRPPCPPVRIDLALVKMPDDSRRVIASSPDGKVVGGVDIPTLPDAPAPRVTKWAAGGVYGVASGGGRSMGAFIHRDLAFIRAGAEVTHDTFTNLPGQWSARAMIGVRF
jgi:hypothetical protein